MIISGKICARVVEENRTENVIGGAKNNIETPSEKTKRSKSGCKCVSDGHREESHEESVNALL